MCSPCPRLCITVAVVMNTTVDDDSNLGPLTLQSSMLPLDRCSLPLLFVFKCSYFPVTSCVLSAISREITMPTPHHSIFTGRVLFLTPNQQCQSPEGILCFIRQQQQQQPFNGRLSGTTWVGRYQKKLLPAHTHPGQRTSFITFLHLQRSTASSLFSLRA